ncbi:virulence RhuM family protein [Marinomonas shanghaiensis]|uniref:virulence RhuM family protein n=1 Tax=Marinomonas shanghaiensis TaxID=2202418 RepID=UPI000DBA426C|nr:RhuM family protein [Marinomonas shanghaiensis]
MTKKTQLSLQDQTSEFLLYTAPNGEVKVEVLLSGETIWLTQKRIAELFGVGVPAISKHLDNIYDSGELQRDATLSILETVQQEGKREVKRKLEYYNLDAVISVGYRVNSTQATQFRIWATQLIKDYIIKGFAMDDERLKNGRFFGKDYFKELLERVRSIRASERRVYQQITDIFAECVNKFLAFNEYQVLEGYGQISRQAAEQKAHTEYEQFNKQQKIESDFDREVKQLLSNKKST